jgi:nicotinamidase-related amidase
MIEFAKVTIASIKSTKQSNSNIHSQTMPGSQKRKYEELKMIGPPLYNQCMVSNFDGSKITDSSEAGCLSLDASRTALLIVDVQPEYWSECPAVRKDFAHFPSKISSLIQNCRTQGAKCIWVRADYAYDRSPWLQQFSRLHQGRIPPVVKPNSKWEEFAEPSDGDLIITKNSWSSTTDTGLLDTLSQAGIDTVLVCGLITSVCVQHSAFGVFEAGYRTILVTDACADRGKERHQAALNLYGDYMYELRTVDSVRDELDEEEIKITLINDNINQPAIRAVCRH